MRCCLMPMGMAAARNRVCPMESPSRWSNGGVPASFPASAGPLPSPCSYPRHRQATPPMPSLVVSSRLARRRWFEGRSSAATSPSMASMISSQGVPGVPAQRWQVSTSSSSSSRDSGRWTSGCPQLPMSPSTSPSTGSVRYASATPEPPIRQDPT